MKYLFFFILFSISISGYSQGQDDHINWSFNKYSFSLNDTWKMDLTPIFRLNNNFTNFQNASIDYTLKRGLAHGLSTAVIGRTWFIPNEKIRQFLWFDLAHQIPDLGIPLKIKHRLRFHWALDINDRVDGDFLRYILHFSPQLNNKIIQPFVAIEPWFHFNGFNEFQRIRWEYGFNFKASKNLTLIAFMRQEDWYNMAEVYTNFIWMTGMQYTFDQALFKNNN